MREEQNARPITTDVEVVLKLFLVLSRWRKGALIHYCALGYFAGIRPMEIQRIQGREAWLINLRTCTITIPANISKTRHERQILISNNLAAWLETFTWPITRPNFGRISDLVRKHFAMTHNEARHSSDGQRMTRVDYGPLPDPILVSANHLMACGRIFRGPSAPLGDR